MSLEGKIQDEVSELILRLEKKTNQPISITDELYLPLVSSLWTMIQGEKIEANDSVFLGMMDEWHRGFFEFGQNIVQTGLANLSFMKILHFFGYVHFDEIFKRFFQYLDPVVQKHKESLGKQDEPTRDWIDRYLLEVQVWPMWDIHNSMVVKDYLQFMLHMLF